MSPLDLSLLVAILGLATWRLAAPGLHPSARALACGGAAVLAAVQTMADGFTWQFVPAWLLLAAVAVPLAPRGHWGRKLAAAGLLGLVAAALGPWAFAPVPVLPPPSGPHPVGTQVFRMIDPGRPETATADPADRRQFNVQAWYPAQAGAGGARLPYMDAVGRLPGPVSIFPPFIFGRFHQVDTHAAGGAVVSDARPSWPVVVFSPGYGAPRAFYSGLAADLASRGYVVLVLDHPYESDVAQLANGKVAGAVWRSPGPGEDWPAFMERLIRIRAGDVRFVIDRVERGDLGPGLGPRLARSGIAAIGHSFGGATSALAAGEDPRIRAAANIDGAIWGSVAAEAFQGPFLLVQSDREETGHGDFFDVSNGDVLARAAQGSWRYEIGRANHFSFTDAPQFFTPPAQWLMARFMGGGRGAPQTQRATVDLLDAFLRGPLTGAPGDLQATAQGHARIEGGRVR